MKKMNSKKWIALLLALLLVFTSVISAAVYIVDPFFQFRVKDNTYLLKERYVSEGLIKNFDYDTLILGSSVTQNFDMELFRERFGCKPLHIGINQLSDVELIKLLKLAQKQNKAEQYYIGLDLTSFNYPEDKPPVDHIPDYLVDDGVMSNIRYFFSYEVWFRYMPIDVPLAIAKKLNISIPERITKNTSIDLLENWSGDYTFSEENVIKQFKSSDITEYSDNNDAVYNAMKKNIDSFLSALDFSGASYTFFYPPYSSLYWAVKENRNCLDAYMKAKNYLTERLINEGAKVYDFQSEDFTIDLNNYRDYTHFKKDINDYMTECFADNKNRLTADNLGEYEKKLRKNLQSFLNSHSDLF